MQSNKKGHKSYYALGINGCTSWSVRVPLKQYCAGNFLVPVLLPFKRMGNSQSIEHIGHAVEKGAEFYKAFKQLEHEHEYLPPSYHYQQQVQHDNPEYTRLRLLAHQEAEKRNQLYEQSQTAYRNGNGAKGLSFAGCV